MRWLLAALLVVISGAAEQPANSQEQIFNQAAEALRRGDYTAAERGFQAVLQAEPGNASALGNLAVVYSRTHRYAEAVRVYQQALGLDASNPALLLNLGLAYLKEEHYEEALPRFAAVAKQQPGNVQAAELKATCLVFLNREAEAIAELEELRGTDPNRGAVLYLLGVAYTKRHQATKARELFAELLSSGLPAAQADLLLGKASYEGGDFATARKFLEEATAAQPELREGQLALARVLISQRENEAAAKQLRTLLSTDPQDADANYLLGALLVNEGQDAAALPYLDRAESALQDSWALAFYRGKAKLQTGHAEEAATLLRRSLELNPDGEQTYYQLARALRASGRPAEAQAALARLREVKGKSLQREQRALGGIPEAR